MEDSSEENIRKNCPHCDRNSPAFKNTLKETNSFYIICDPHPIIEGHILIIPKKHVSCVGEYNQSLFEEFRNLNDKVSQFLQQEYKSVSSFEHGVFGQTVFHSHIHYLPFNGESSDIIPEKEKLTKIKSFKDLKTSFKKDGGYLYFSIDKEKWIVDPSISTPRFFRDRFAKVLGRQERGNWKEMRFNEKIMGEAKKEIVETKKRWKNL